MATKGILLEATIGKKLSKAAEERREILFRALPKIEEHYAHLSRARPKELDRVSSQARDEAIGLYNKVVADGRYVELLKTDPAAAADKLGVKISEEANRAIATTGSQILGPGAVMGPIEAVIAVVVVIACAHPMEGYVIDEAAQIKTRL